MNLRIHILTMMLFVGACSVAPEQSSHQAVQLSESTPGIVTEASTRAGRSTSDITHILADSLGDQCNEFSNTVFDECCHRTDGKPECSTDPRRGAECWLVTCAASFPGKDTPPMKTDPSHDAFAPCRDLGRQCIIEGAECQLNGDACDDCWEQTLGIFCAGICSRAADECAETTDLCLDALECLFEVLYFGGTLDELLP